MDRAGIIRGPISDGTIAKETTGAGAPQHSLSSRRKSEAGDPKTKRRRQNLSLLCFSFSFSFSFSFCSEEEEEEEEEEIVLIDQREPSSSLNLHIWPTMGLLLLFFSLVQLVFFLYFLLRVSNTLY